MRLPISWLVGNVPAHAGGVDLSKVDALALLACRVVPAHAGGVDLSIDRGDEPGLVGRPRPCGRGGFKRNQELYNLTISKSPPMRAGWI